MLAGKSSNTFPLWRLVLLTEYKARGCTGYSNGETKDTISNRVYLEQIRLEFIEIDTCL